MEEGYLIGVDGGGTKTKAVAARTDGTVLATAVGGGLNAGQIGAGRAKENLLGVLKRLTGRWTDRPRASSWAIRRWTGPRRRPPRAPSRGAG